MAQSQGKTSRTRNDKRKSGKAAKKHPRLSPSPTGRGKASGNSQNGYGVRPEAIRARTARKAHRIAEDERQLKAQKHAAGVQVELDA